MQYLDVQYISVTVDVSLYRLPTNIFLNAIHTVCRYLFQALRRTHCDYGRKFALKALRLFAFNLKSLHLAVKLDSQSAET